MTPRAALWLVLLALPATAAAAQKPNLVPSPPGSPPAAQTPGGSFSILVAVRNRGAAGARASRTGFYLSKDRKKSKDDAKIGTARLAKLRQGRRATRTVPLSIPTSVPDGSYFLLACADDGSALREKSEKDNCAATKAPVRVAGPASVTPPQASEGPPGEVAGPPAPAPFVATLPRVWQLRNTNGPGAADLIFFFGAHEHLPVTGDWNGDGTDTPGTFDPATRTWRLRNSNTSGAPDLSFTFGGAGELPVTGDWNGDGTETVGTFDPSTGIWALRNANSAGNPDLAFVFKPGFQGALTPLAGDWNNDGTDTIGVADATGNNALRDTNSGGVPDYLFVFQPPGASRLVGDWTNTGTDRPGSFTEGTWGIRLSNTSGTNDLAFTFGSAGDQPVTGNWDGLGNDTIGVTR